MIAARLLGLREFSYAALVERYFRVQLTKGSQKANWAQRPLSSQMERYARNDTHYLLPLAQMLEQQLKERGRLEWFFQSCERAILAAAIDRERDAEEVWRIRGSGAVRGRAAAVLRAIWAWRETEAQQADRPPFHILRNEQLIQAAETAVKGKMPDFRHFSERRARDFQTAIQKAMALPEEEWPTKEMERAADEMRKRRDAAAHELGVEPSFIAPRATIDAIAADGSRSDQLLVGWQRKLLGCKGQTRSQ
jgi:ribonuclease D